MSKEWIFFNSRDELERIEVSKIVYFEAEGNYTNIITANNFKCSVCMNLAQMEKLLAASLKEKAMCFVRIGKSYIINLNYVCQLNVLRKRLVLSDFCHFTYTLELSKEALKKLKELILIVKI